MLLAKSIEIWKTTETLGASITLLATLYVRFCCADNHLQFVSFIITLLFHAIVDDFIPWSFLILFSSFFAGCGS